MRSRHAGDDAPPPGAAAVLIKPFLAVSAIAVVGISAPTLLSRTPPRTTLPSALSSTVTDGSTRAGSIAATQAGGAAAGAPGRLAVDGPLKLGVQTHFSQGWPISALQQASSVHARSLRDGMPWPSGERVPGRYVLPPNALTALSAFCRSGGDVVLTIEPRNRLYDEGLTVSSDAGINAYAAYIVAVVAGLGDRCVAAIEVGNEINNPRNLPYAAGTDVPARYVALVRATRSAVRARGFHAAILGGSTNVIGTGFLAGLFRAGLLEAADGIAVHPYRRQAENVDVELAHLNSVMARHGRPLPIWATEFSHTHPDPAAAAGDLLKMTTMMSAAGVARAYWYALLYQPGFPTLGLFTPGRDRKPAADAFALVAGRLADAGRAVRVDAGDDAVRVYRLGRDRYVVWGVAGRIRFTGQAIVRDAQGGIVPGNGPFAIGLDPIMVEGATGYTIDQGVVLADSLLGYGSAPWSYRAERAGGASVPLDWYDSSFGSVHGTRSIRPAAISDLGGTPAGGVTNAIRVIVRYTAPVAQSVSFAACVHKGSAKASDGIDVVVRVDGRESRRVVVTEGGVLSGIDAQLKAGGTIDLVFGPNQTEGGDAFSFRAWILKGGARTEPRCP